MSAMKEVPCSP